jgi:hypothetical protein
MRGRFSGKIARLVGFFDSRKIFISLTPVPKKKTPKAT